MSTPGAPDTADVVHRFLEALVARDAQRLASLCADTVDWYIPGNEQLAPWLGRRSTPAGVEAYARTLFDNTRPVSANVHRTYVDGDSAVVTGEFVTHMLATGKAMASPFSAELTIKDGRIVRYRLLEDSYALVEALTA